jgi:hypothetical protein
MSYDIVTLRTALIITLSILVVVMIARRVRRRVFEASIPAISHAELLSLDVLYHPSRLQLVLKLPESQLIRTALLDQEHKEFHEWPEGRMEQGVHRFERVLPPLADGQYYLVVATRTQRTVRQFRLQ